MKKAVNLISQLFFMYFFIISFSGRKIFDDSAVL